MSNSPKATDVAERLRMLQEQHRLTIQEMADRIGLPKRSLENYMNLKTPQRPGVDALIAIADGFNVSLDWLVGRSGPKDTGEFSVEDYAAFCQSAILHLLIRIMDAMKDDPQSAIDCADHKIMGYALHEIAAVAMLDFVRIVELQSRNPERPKDYFKRHFDSLRTTAVESEAKRETLRPPDRKP